MSQALVEDSVSQLEEARQKRTAAEEAALVKEREAATLAKKKADLESQRQMEEEKRRAAQNEVSSVRNSANVRVAVPPMVCAHARHVCVCVCVCVCVRACVCNRADLVRMLAPCVVVCRRVWRGSGRHRNSAKANKF